MEELKLNYQLCYFDLHNAKGVGVNLLMFGYRQFSETYLYQNRDVLRSLCENFESKTPDINNMSKFALNNLIDSVKIHICIENYLKSIFIIQGVIVHKLDRSIFPEKSKKQKKEPVIRDEVIKPDMWKENPRIKLKEQSMRLQVPGILKNTIGTSILMKSGYWEALGFNQNTALLFIPYLEYRNNLHYYTDESFSLSESSSMNLDRMINFVNSNVVTLQNQLVNELSMGEQYKIKPLPQ